MNHFRSEEVSVLIQETFGLVNHTTSEVLDGKAQSVRLGADVQLAFDIPVDFIWNINIMNCIEKPDNLILFSTFFYNFFIQP